MLYCRQPRLPTLVTALIIAPPPSSLTLCYTLQEDCRVYRRQLRHSPCRDISIHCDPGESATGQVATATGLHAPFSGRVGSACTAVDADPGGASPHGWAYSLCCLRTDAGSPLPIPKLTPHQSHVHPNRIPKHITISSVRIFLFARERWNRLSHSSYVR